MMVLIKAILWLIRPCMYLNFNFWRVVTKELCASVYNTYIPCPFFFEYNIALITRRITKVALLCNNPTAFFFSSPSAVVVVFEFRHHPAPRKHGQTAFDPAGMYVAGRYAPCDLRNYCCCPLCKARPRI